MQPAQKPQYFCLACDSFGILYDVADAGVRTAGDDVNTCVCHISQCCVIVDDVGNSLSVNDGFADGVCRFKIYGMGDFSQKNKVICEPQEFFGKFQHGFCTQFFHRQRTANVHAVPLFGQQGMGVGNEPWLFGKRQCQQVRQTAGVVVMPMRKQNGICRGQINAHGFGVFQKSVRIARIE